MTRRHSLFVVSLFFIGSVCGALLAGPLNHQFGTKRLAIFIALVINIQWGIVAFKTNLTWILISRIVSGMCYGAFLVFVKVYNAEITHPNLRGSTSSFYTTNLSLGFCFGLTCGYLVRDLHLLCALFSIPSLLFLFLSLFIPNSPFWLVQVGREADAKNYLQWLRGSTYDISKEFQQIKEKKLAKDAENDQLSFWNKVQSQDLWQPLLRVGALLVLIEIGGMNITSQYLVVIFKLSGSNMDPYLAPLVVGGFRFGLGLCSTVIHRFVPRRPFILICCMVVSISYVSVGLFTYFHDYHNSKAVQAFSWIPVVGLVLIQVCDTVGFLVVINLNLQPESFPTQYRSVGCGLCGVITAFARFVMSKLFAQLIEYITFAGAFTFFGAMFVIIGIYCFFVVPENKGQCLVLTEEKLVK